MSDRENHDGIFSFDVAAAIPEARFVKLDDANTVSVAALTETPFGVTKYITSEIGDGVAVTSRKKPGTVTVEAAGVIAFGADVYCVADGKASASSAGGAIKAGVAMEASAADGDYIQILLDS